MQFVGSVGPQSKSAADGTQLQARLGRVGDVVVSELHARYFEQMRSGNMWSAANQAAQAVSVGLSATYTGLLLFNPVGSGKLLVPNFVKFALSVAPVAIATIGLLSGFATTGGVTAQTVKLVPQSNQLGNGATPAGIALSSATITTPVYAAQLWDGFTAGALPAPQVPVDLAGEYGLLPGAYLGIAALTAVTGLGSISWEEIDLPL